MTELSISFTTEKDDSPIQSSLFWTESGTRTNTSPFSPPLGDKELDELHWYLETFSVWPTGPDYQRAERIEGQMEGWGKVLLESVTESRDVIKLWQQFVEATTEDKQLTIDATDPRVLRLPWELLADDGGHLFSQGISIRRRLQQATSAPIKDLTLPVRLLVLVCRPDDAGFIDPRAVSQPLLDALDQLGGRVEVEFLYPPTLKVLTGRLRDRKKPPVHIVHFDGHGVYDAGMGLGYLLFENEKHKSDRVDANRLGTLLNRSGVPLMVLNACQSAKQEETNPYASVAARLIRAGVGSVLAMNYSVLVVAAEKFVAAFYDNLATGLTVGQAVDEGRVALLADEQRHTITRRDASGNQVEETVSLRDWFLPALYQLSEDPVFFDSREEDGRPPSATAELETIDAGVKSAADRQRGVKLLQIINAHFNKEDLRTLCFNLGINYDDLPAEGRSNKARELVLQLEALDRLTDLVTEGKKMRPGAAWDKALQVTAAAPVTAAQGTKLPGPERSLPHALVDPKSPGGLPAQPLHGFHGRAREMLQLERALAQYPIVVLHGFGGLGKTALAAEAGRWFHRTGRFPGGAAFVSFEHGGSLQQLCSWVGQAVSGDPDFTIGEGDPVERIAGLLAEKPALVILDNFESVLGNDPLMPAEELQDVLDAVYRWAGEEGGSGRKGEPGSSVLITTRDTAINDARFGPSRNCTHIGLGGLARPDALALAAAVLDDHGIDRGDIPRQELVELMDRLGGHPLSLYLVLPHLREHSPAELSQRFEELLPGFKTGEAKKRNESLSVSLEFSLRRLGQETRDALPALAIFQGAAFEDDLLEITEIDSELWPSARAEMERAALVTVETVPGINPPFLRFHPTLLPYLSDHLPQEDRMELEERYWQRYYAVARYLYQTDSQHPHLARAVAIRELPNLRRALELAIEAGESEAAVDFANRIARFLDVFGRWREREAMMARVAGLQVTGDGGITKAEFLMRSQQGESLWQQGRAAEAEQIFHKLLADLKAEAAYDTAYDQALTKSWLGRCLEAQGQTTQAISWHRQALDCLEPLRETDENARGMMGVVYADLADNLVDIGRFDEAQQAYESGLKISRSIGDDRQIGVILGQLGTLALQRGDLKQARLSYLEALDTFHTEDPLI